MERRSFFAWLLGLLWGTSQATAKPDLSAAQALFDDAIVLKPQVMRLSDDIQITVDCWQHDTATLLIQPDPAHGVAWVTGLPADVEAFCRLYQDKLWPGWQQTDLAAAKRCFDAARKGWATGTAAVNLHGAKCREAFEQTVKAWTKPFVIV